MLHAIAVAADVPRPQLPLSESGRYVNARRERRLSGRGSIITSREVAACAS